MNREVEERLVAMYFDNQDFEKHAKETINTLDQLKESMNLEDSVKGFDVFNKMKRNAGMEQMQRSANKLKDTFSSIGPILTKAFSIGAGPLKTLENAFGSIQGYINKYLGFDFASKIVGGVENAIRGLTVQPVSQGWQQYENEVDSVKTIMSSTGETIQVVGKNLDDLRNYADKTVYSLNDMTSNLGKFTNNGVKLEDATKAMMGVTNAAALAGQGTQQASMAMYNISQAIGVGKMTSIDWKSIENANMATQQLKNTLIEVAAAKGQLKKVEKDGVTTYFVYKDSNGKEIKNPKKWQEVNFKNFRETLQKDWLDSDSLVATLMGFSGQNLTPQQWKALGIEDKGLINKLQQIGKEALEAASQVRTFSKLMATLKDSVASGWSESFKFIFGNADEATKLWTGVSDRIGGALTASATRRNDVLDKWKKTREVLGTTTVDSGSSAGIVEKVIYGRNGREILIDGLKNLADVFGDLGRAVRKAFGEVFGTVTGEDLFGKTVQFEKLTIRIKEWLGSMDDSNSRLNKIFRIVRGVLSAFKLWRNMIKNVANTLIKLLVPGASDIIDILASVADFFYELTTLKPEEILQKIGEKIKQVWEKIKSWFTPKDLFDEFGNKVGTEVPILRWFSDLFQKLGDVGGKLLTELGLGDFVAWIQNFWNNVTTAWNNLKSKIEGNETLQELGKFLSNVWQWIVETAKGAAETLEGFFGPNDNGSSQFVEWITNLWDNISTAWTSFVTTVNNEVNNPDGVLAGLGKFLSNAWAWIYEKAVEVYNGAADFFFGADDNGSSKFVEWITGLWDSITSAWTTFVTTVNNEVNNPDGVLAGLGKFLSNAWAWIYEKAVEVYNGAADFFFGADDNGSSKFVEWITGLWDNITSAWTTFVTTVDNEVNNPDGVLAGLGKFLSNAWAWIYEKAVEVYSYFGDFFSPDANGSSKFVEWITGLWDNITSAWTTFVTTVDNEVNNPDGVLAGLGKFLSNAWAWIYEKAVEVYNGAADFFFGADDNGSSKFVEWITGLWGRITEAWNTFYTEVTAPDSILSKIGKFLSNIWAWIVEEAVHKYHQVVNFFSPDANGSSQFVEWITGLWGRITKAWEDFLKEVEKPDSILSEIGRFLSNAWEWLVDKARKMYRSAANLFKPDANGSSKFVEWITGLWGRITDAWNTFVSDIHKPGSILNEIGQFLSNAWQWIVETAKNAADDLTGFFAPDDNGSSDFLEWLDGFWGKVEEAWGNLVGIVKESAENGILKEIGQFLSNTWEWLLSFLRGSNNSEVGDAGGENSDLSEAAEVISDTAEDAYGAVEPLVQVEEKLGGNIEEKLSPIKSFFESIFKGIQDIISGIGDHITSNGGDLTHLSAFIDSLGKFINGVLDWLTRIFGTMGEVLSGEKGIGALWGDLLFPLLSWFGSQALLGLINKWTGGMAVSQTIKNIGMAVIMIALAVVALGQLDQEKLSQGMGAVTTIAVLVGIIGTIIAAISSSSGGIVKNHPTIEKLGTVLLQELGKAGMLYIMMQMLPTIIEAIADFKNKTNGADLGMDILLTLVGVVGAMMTAGIAIALVGKMSAGVSIGGAGKALLEMIVGFAIIVGALYGITALFPNVDEMHAFAEKASVLGEAVGGFIGGLFGNLFGEAWRGLTGQMNEKEKAEQKNKDFEVAVDQLIKLSDNLSDDRLGVLMDLTDRISALRVTDTYYAGDMLTGIDFNNFTTGLNTFVDAMIRLLRSLNGDGEGLIDVLYSSDNRVDKFIEAVKKCFSIFNSINKTTYEFFKNGDYKNFFSNLSDFSDTSSGSSKFDIFIDDVGSLFGTIAEKSDTLAKYADNPDIEKFIQRLNDLNTIVNLIFSVMYGTPDQLASGAPGGMSGLENIYSMLYGPSDNAIHIAMDERRRRFGIFLADVDSLYSVLMDHEYMSEYRTDWGVVKFLTQLNEMLTVFTENGIGSETWMSNLDAFEAFSRDSDAVKKWIDAIDNIYIELQSHPFGTDEGITFNGLDVVKSLFAALEEGFKSPDIPSIDATPVTDAIITAIGFGETALAQAVHDMVQAGINESAKNPDKFGGYTIPGVEGFDVGNIFSMFQNGGLENLLSEENINSYLGPFLSQLDDPNGPLNKALSQIETKFGAAFDLNKFMNESGLMFQDESGEMVNAFEYVKDLSDKVSDTLNTADPITFKVTPVFNLDELTRANLQEQLNGLGLSAPITMPNVGIDFTMLKTELGMDSIQLKLDMINDSIKLWGASNTNATGNLGSHMDGIRNEISGMHMVLDSGVLVGQILPMIDRGLYDRALLVYRSGTAPNDHTYNYTLTK